jgi:hypothetical protein
VPEPAAEKPSARRSLAKRSAESKPATTELSPVSLQAAPAETDSQPAISESTPLADTEAEPEVTTVAPQEKSKKVATGSAVKRAPIVEERRLPPGKRPKTVWDEFRESFKQGRKERVCTQAEIALNQCP